MATTASKTVFTENALSWQGVYYPFNEWRKDGSWKKLWVTLLHLHKPRLNLSSIRLDSSHTRTHTGGAAIGYQGRKAARTTNLLFLADNTGQPLACATPQAGNHHDLFAIETSFGELYDLVEEVRISLDGLFLHTDSGFGTSSLGDDCFRRGIEANIAQKPHSGQKEAAADSYFDEELYRQRTAIERTNARLEGFKTLLVRYESNVDNWLAFHFLVFTVLLLRKIPSE